MTPERFLEENQDVITSYHDRIKLFHRICRDIIAATVSSILFVIVASAVQHQDITHHQNYVFGLAVLTGLVIVVDSYQLLSYPTYWRNRRVLRVPKLMNTHKLTAIALPDNRYIWVFYRPLTKTTYSIFDADFRCVRHNFRLTKGYHHAVNLELDIYDEHTVGLETPYIDEFLNLFQIDRHAIA